MKKWQEGNNLRQHNIRIKNAKSTFSNTKTSQGSRSVSKDRKQKQSTSTQKSLFYSPLYSILCTFGLQQYAEQLVDLGFGYDFNKFKELKGQKKERLLFKIGVKTKDKIKISTLFDYLSNMVTKISQIQQTKPLKKYSQIQQKKPKIPLPSRRRESSNIIKQATCSLSQQSRSTINKRNQLNISIDDSVILHKTNNISGDIQPTFSRTFITERISKKTNINQNLDDLNLNIQKIKCLYLSYDNGSISSNITNIDIQELANCFAKQIHGLIRYEQIVQKLQNSNILQKSQLDYVEQEIDDHPITSPVSFIAVGTTTPFTKLPQFLQVVDEANQSFFQSAFQNKKSIIQSILKESMLKNTDTKSPITVQDQIEEQSQKSNVARNTSLSMNGISQVYVQFNICDKNKLQEFENRQLDDISRELPSQHVVEDYIKNLIISLKMEKQAPVFAFIYLQRLLSRISVQYINQLSWRNIILVVLLLGSKVWDDCSLQNDTISKLLPSHSVLQLNRLQKIFVRIVEYRLSINPGQYAEGYFKLRTHCKEVKHSKGLKPLTIQQIRSFQKNTTKLQIGLRAKYKQSLNKSF